LLLVVVALAVVLLVVVVVQAASFLLRPYLIVEPLTQFLLELVELTPPLVLASMARAHPSRAQDSRLLQHLVVAEEVLISRKPSQALVDGVALQAVAPAAILLLERQVLRLRVIQAAQL
jgi:hypothetical protein